jgi:hypothetical protein
MLRRTLVLTAPVLALALPALADPPKPAPTPPPLGCPAAESRQFDFWVGDWDVSDPQGQQVGRNTIKLILHDCVLFENWEGSQGGSGKSFNLYSTRDHLWHQFWVDARGGMLNLAGGLENGAMVLRGEQAGANGARVLNRITWRKLDADRVSQVWDASKDAGTTWKVLFDGIYVRRR